MSVELESAEVQSLKARLDELETEVRRLKGDGRPGRRRRKESVDVLEAPEQVSRRRMLGMLKGAAAAGAGLAVITSAEPAFATAVTTGTIDGDALRIGFGNTNSGGMTSLTGNTGFDSGNPLLRLLNNGTGLHIALIAGSFGAGGVGVSGFGDSVGVEAGSGVGAALRVNDNSVPMPPVTGTWQTGSFVNSGGQIWYCYTAGVGSASKWVRLSSSFVPVTPTRVYDSRVGAPLPTGILLAGANRLVSVADGRNGAGGVSIANLVPAGATAVTANVTVTGTTSGFGYLAINPGGNTVEGASAINWFGAGQTLANGVTLTLNANRELTVICNGASGASTDFIIDVSGYYL